MSDQVIFGKSCCINVVFSFYVNIYCLHYTYMFLDSKKSILNVIKKLCDFYIEISYFKIINYEKNLVGSTETKYKKDNSNIIQVGNCIALRFTCS